ncbi:hypothetical protein FHW04_001095 [Pantoea sp. AN62]|uniref:hypothetical protein n=1 Tax=Pantoea TaxID=53335 RepID=UPI000A21CFD8|nr:MULTISPECIES: hypothetical protein [Pantoea]MCQ5469598.1 hypothetical protein [Pantoea brenneri]MDU4745138.1 hypothetical protein [Pantoea sp.]ORM60274.1 hypothetical protein HA39_03925 [Pantoea brenneri]OXM25255.1 hypothetical protein CBI35_09390 [Pantoea sp. AV62]
MALYYYVNKQSGYNHNHVVHAAGCPFLAAPADRLFLGSFYHVNAAILQAKKYYSGAMGCETCCPSPRHSDADPQPGVALKHTLTSR